MKALTLPQPWASLVVCGAKRIETRSWPTKYVGELLIHSSAKFPAEAKALCDTWPFRQALYAMGYTVANLPTGAMLGTVLMTSCVPATPLEGWPTDVEAAFGNFAEDRWAWLMDNAYVFKRPIRWKGSLGVFNVPDADWKNGGPETKEKGRLL